MIEDRIKHLLQSCAESTLNLSEDQANQIALAGEALSQTLLQEGKILVAGNGSSSAIGQILVATLLNRLEHERPGLPAIHLGTDTTVVSAIANDNSFNDIFHKQIRTLGNAGDTLVLVSVSGKSSNLVQAVAAAHDRDLRIISLTGGDGGDIATLLNSQDIDLRAPGLSLAAIQQNHLLMVYCLCDLVEFHLFGVQHPL